MNNVNADVITMNCINTHTLHLSPSWIIVSGIVHKCFVRTSLTCEVLEWDIEGVVIMGVVLGQEQ